MKFLLGRSILYIGLFIMFYIIQKSLSMEYVHMVAYSLILIHLMIPNETQK